MLFCSDFFILPKTARHGNWRNRQDLTAAIVQEAAGESPQAPPAGFLRVRNILYHLRIAVMDASGYNQTGRKVLPVIHIRPATPGDAPALLAIYAPYVTDTAITFEYDVPAPADFRQRIETTLRTHPYLVLERDGDILGYAYTGQLGSRAAYAWAAETSIYLRQDCRRGGLGTRLYHALEEASRAQNVQVLYACIAAPTGADDPHLSRASIDFHTRLGYTAAGTFHRCGYKFGTWYDVVWMEKRLSDDAVPPAVVPFSPESR